MDTLTKPALDTTDAVAARLPAILMDHRNRLTALCDLPTATTLRALRQALQPVSVWPNTPFSALVPFQTVHHWRDALARKQGLFLAYATMRHLRRALAQYLARRDLTIPQRAAFQSARTRLSALLDTVEQAQRALRLHLRAVADLRLALQDLQAGATHLDIKGTYGLSMTPNDVSALRRTILDTETRTQVRAILQAALQWRLGVSL